MLIKQEIKRKNKKFKLQLKSNKKYRLSKMETKLQKYNRHKLKKKISLKKNKNQKQREVEKNQPKKINKKTNKMIIIRTSRKHKKNKKTFNKKSHPVKAVLKVKVNLELLLKRNNLIKNNIVNLRSKMKRMRSIQKVKRERKPLLLKRRRKAVKKKKFKAIRTKRIIKSDAIICYK